MKYTGHPASRCSMALTAALAAGNAIAAELDWFVPVLAEDPSLLDQRPGLVRAARIDAGQKDALREAQTVRLDVFGLRLDIERTEFSVRNGGWTWEGVIANDLGNGIGVGNPVGWAQFVQQDGRLAGYLQPAGFSAAIEITPLADGTSAFVQIDPDGLPDPGQPLSPDIASESAISHESVDDPHAVNGGMSHVDAMVTYTPAAAAEVGGHAGVSARAHADVVWLNRAFANNGIDMRYRLVAVKPLPLVEPADNDWGPLLASFRESPTARAWRDHYGADMMSIYVHREKAPVCGLGYVMRNIGAGFSEWAYQLTWINCSATTWAHESGHNMGLEHDPGNSDVGTTPEQASRPYSFGHGVADGGNSFRTIMAYGSVCGEGNPCSVVWAYSTPTRTLHGHPIGISNERHNARTLNDHTRQVVAAFRTSQVLFQDGFD